MQNFDTIPFLIYTKHPIRCKEANEKLAPQIFICVPDPEIAIDSLAGVDTVAPLLCGESLNNESKDGGLLLVGDIMFENENCELCKNIIFSTNTEGNLIISVNSTFVGKIRAFSRMGKITKEYIEGGNIPPIDMWVFCKALVNGDHICIFNPAI
jgi:hypothetical protein